jgi:hypothetical protein
MINLKKAGLILAIVAGGLAVPAVAYAQPTGPAYCNYITPAVRDVVQDAPALAAVLNLDAAISDEQIQVERDKLGCGPAPEQTPEQARGLLCNNLNEARVEELVAQSGNDTAIKALEALRPGLPQIIAASRDQLGCGEDAGAPVAVAPPAAGDDAAVDADGDGYGVTKDGAQVVVKPNGWANTGDGSTV